MVQNDRHTLEFFIIKSENIYEYFSKVLRNNFQGEWDVKIL
jgi:hypothetical protein